MISGMKENELLTLAFAPYASVAVPREGGASLFATLSLLLASVGASLGEDASKIEGARWVLPEEASALLDEAFPCPREIDEQGRRARLFGYPVFWTRRKPCA